MGTAGAALATVFAQAVSVMISLFIIRAGIEMLQEMILAALARTDFFVKAAFHGGTQLRIFEGLRRFSEDLDFALVSTDDEFDLLPLFQTQKVCF